MQNFKKILLLILVLLPSIFFLSRAFSGNSASIEKGKLVVTGPGGFEKELEDISRIEVINGLPELSGTGGFSLGLIKKGNFIRAKDNKEVRLVKNSEELYIHLVDDREMEAYLSLGSKKETRSLYSELREYVE